MSLPKRNSLLWSSPCVLVDLRNGISQSNHGNPCWLRKTLVEQGDQKSQSYRKSILNIHWKDCCWSSNTLATWCKELTHWKRPWCWKDWGKEKGVTEDERLDSITDSMDRSLSKVWETVKDRRTWSGVKKNWTQLSDWITTTKAFTNIFTNI